MLAQSLNETRWDSYSPPGKKNPNGNTLAGGVVDVLHIGAVVVVTVVDVGAVLGFSTRCANTINQTWREGGGERDGGESSRHLGGTSAARTMG